MMRVREATYTPSPEGDQIEATLDLRAREVSTIWKLGDEDADVRQLVDSLAVKVRQTTFLQSQDGAEIRVTLTIGDRSFVSRLPIDEDDLELKASLDRLMDEIGSGFLRAMQSELRAESQLSSVVG